MLRDADLIAPEDTRSAKTLVAHADAFGTVNPVRRVISYFEGNEAEREEEIYDALMQGRDVALISEAGMPGISDPGARAIAAAIEVGARVEVIPGPNAAIAALVASGLPTDRFTFLGFPPRETGARQELFGTLRGEVATMIFYEAPDRVGATLADLAAALGGDRRASLGRELTKLHEEILRGRAAGVAALLAARPGVKGEFAIAVAPPGAQCAGRSSS